MQEQSNRIIRWAPAGAEYEPDQRHAESVISELGLQSANPVSTPSIPEPVGEAVVKLLDSDGATRYRSIAARINFPAQD